MLPKWRRNCKRILNPPIASKLPLVCDMKKVQKLKSKVKLLISPSPTMANPKSELMLKKQTNEIYSTAIGHGHTLKTGDNDK